MKIQTYIHNRTLVLEEDLDESFEAYRVHLLKPYSYFSIKKNICCGYLLEVPQWAISNECPKHMFLWINKKNTNHFWLKKCKYGAI